MKSIIDNQELRIQKNMMEIEFEGLCMDNTMTKKASSGTASSDHMWEDYSREQIGESWNVFNSS